MRTFLDATGETWGIDLTIADFDNLYQRLNIDLLSADEKRRKDAEELILGSNLRTLSRALAIILDEERERRKISAADFAKRMRGDALDRAHEALLESYADFFPSGRGQPLRDLIPTLREARKELAAAAKQAKRPSHK